MSEKSFFLKVLGCKANISDSEWMRAILNNTGWKESRAQEGVVIGVLHSCAVTAEAEKKSFLIAKRFLKKNPNAKLIYTGCAAALHQKKWEAISDRVWCVPLKQLPYVQDVFKKIFSNQQSIKGETSSDIEEKIPFNKEVFLKYRKLNETAPHNITPPKIELKKNKIQKSQNSLMPISMIAPSVKHSRVFLKIQEGCNTFCTYCVIASLRGEPRSVPPEKVLSWVQHAAQAGAKEIVFTGTNLGRYEFEGSTAVSNQNDLSKDDGLSKLLKLLLKQHFPVRYRLSSLDPCQFTDVLAELMMNHPQVCPHIHLSLQSPVSEILRKMKRPYRWEDVEMCFRKIKVIQKTRGNVFVGMDVITGFPGESTDLFEKTKIRLMDLAPWSRLHVFPYSERVDTPATRIQTGWVDPRERKVRSKQLQRMSMRRLEDWYQKLLNKDEDLEVFFEQFQERDGVTYATGISAEYAKVELEVSEKKRFFFSKIHLIKPVSYRKDVLRKEIFLKGALNKRNNALN